MISDPVALLLGKLAEHPEVVYRLVGEALRIEPPNDGGFAILLQREGAEWVVYFGERGLHEHFADAEEALEFVAFGLSDECRLRELRTIPLLHRSRVERRTNHGWVLVSEFGRARTPFGRGPREAIFRNRLITTGGAG